VNDSIHDQLELYAAAALTSQGMITFDDHLASCGLCQSKAPDLLEAVASLIPDSEPPAATWNRIIAAIEI